MTVTHVVLTLLALTQLCLAYAFIRFANTTEKDISGLYYSTDAEFSRVHNHLAHLQSEMANAAKSDAKSKRTVVKKAAVKTAVKKAAKKA
jgi:hypothetical protein